MTDPILYLSMLLGLGGVYVLISSFNDDDDGDDDGEKYIYNLENANLKINIIVKLFFKKRKHFRYSYRTIFSIRPFL